jgi:hypothetical protein
MRPSAAHLAWIPNPVYREGARLGEEITHLCACIHAATYRLLVLIREFDENTYWGLPGMCSCAHWLNMQCGIGMNAAREKVRVAHALKELPGISEAFRKGELSYSKVRAMTRVANEHNENYLLMIAPHGTARPFTWRSWCRSTVAASDCRTRRMQRNSTSSVACAVTTMTTVRW